MQLYLKYFMGIFLLFMGMAIPGYALEIHWYGQSAFLFKGESGIKFMTDPYQTGGFGDKFRYEAIKEPADIITVSHEHGDHNGTDTIAGKPSVIKTLGITTVKNIPITGIASKHDKAGGTLRGKNTIYCFTIDQLRICHLGDLGEFLSKAQIAEILKGGSIDVLLVPVGGTYTLEPDEMKTIIKELNPRVVIPMHFKTPKVDLPLKPVDNFLAGEKDIKRINASTWNITKKTLPQKKEIIVFNPSN